MKGIFFKCLICSCIFFLCLVGKASGAQKKNESFFFKPFLGIEYQYEHIKSHGAYHLLLSSNFQYGNLFLGAKVHKNFGIELGYYRSLKTSQNQFQFTDWGGSEVSGLTSSISRTSFKGFSADANIYYALDPYFNVFAVLGLATMQESLTVSGTGSTDLAPALSLLSGRNNTVPRLGMGVEYIEKHWGMRSRILWVYTQSVKLNVDAAQTAYPPIYAHAYLQAVLATVGIFYIF